MSDPPGMRHIPVYIDAGIYREIKVYAAQTDQTIQQVVKPISEKFAQNALELISQIRDMKDNNKTVEVF